MIDGKKLRPVRRTAQVLFLLIFLYLLVNTSFPLKTPVLTETFLKLSPLAGIITVVD